LLKEGSRVENITSSIGADVFGVQLSQLDDKGKDELALFVAQKKVVAFRDQVGSGGIFVVTADKLPGLCIATDSEGAGLCEVLWQTPYPSNLRGSRGIP
jgi:alpha-ketoglutarate-dependent taurine dioxygenase